MKKKKLSLVLKATQRISVPASTVPCQLAWQSVSESTNEKQKLKKKKKSN